MLPSIPAAPASASSSDSPAAGTCANPAPLPSRAAVAVTAQTSALQVRSGALEPEQELEDDNEHDEPCDREGAVPVSINLDTYSASNAASAGVGLYQGTVRVSAARSAASTTPPARLHGCDGGASVTSTWSHIS